MYVRRLSKGATQMAVSVTLYILGLTNEFLLTILFIKKILLFKKNME